MPELELVIHIAAGAVALLSGGIALLSSKGGRVHKSAGNFFLISMLIMAVTGTVIAFFDSTLITVLVGSLTAYLVVSGWYAFTRQRGNWRTYDALSLITSLSITGFGLWLTNRAFGGITDNIDGYLVPPGVFIFFSLFAFLAVIGDVIVLFKPRLPFSYTLSRHLWRMGVALYIAAASFFDGQADLFPAALQGSLWLSAPQNLIALLVLFWLLKVALGRKFELKTS